ncbi:MAG TPA: GNAT family N-acetyltransferase [Methylomirabilota bacterium]|nr:GNAT family N-acetyltransferase [Methylomirabilota bacterium]
MSPAIVVTTLSTSPIAPLALLLAESEAAGLRLVRRLVDEWAGGVTRFDQPGEALFVARLAERVVGVCGLSVDPYGAAPGTGRVRHLYVLRAHRRLGVGRRLMLEVIASARDSFDVLRLRTTNPVAAALYVQLGFRQRDDVADCTHVLELR